MTRKPDLPDYGDEPIMTDSPADRAEDPASQRENTELKRGPFRGFRGLFAFFMIGQGSGGGIDPGAGGGIGGA